MSEEIDENTMKEEQEEEERDEIEEKEEKPGKIRNFPVFYHEKYIFSDAQQQELLNIRIPTQTKKSLKRKHIK